MRLLFFIHVFCLFTLSSCLSTKEIIPGEFSGEIVYRTTIIPTITSLNVDSVFNSITGDETRYMINDSSYKSEYYKNGEFVYSFTYDSENKRMYDYTAGKEYITYRDSQQPNDTELELIINRDSTITVLGYEAYQTINNTYENTSTTYYSDAIRVNYAAFQGHNVGHWYERLQLTDGAISLKSITYKETHNEVLEAVSVKQKDFHPSEFEIPENLPVVASYSMLDEQVELINPTPNQIRCYQTKIAAAPDIFENEDRPFTSYVGFIVTKQGKAIFPFVPEPDEYGLSEISVDIIKTCNLNFRPGKMDGEVVESESYLPVNFQL